MLLNLFKFVFVEDYNRSAGLHQSQF